MLINKSRTKFVETISKVDNESRSMVMVIVITAERKGN